MAIYRERKITLKERLENFIKGIARKILAEEIKNYEWYEKTYSIKNFTALENELKETKRRAENKERKLQKEIELLKMTITYIKEENNIK
ncbi:TPA: hypothetical protein KPI68_003926 [Clostridioides difficile]|nr:hypothetical protein [Clostridioides difficile]